MFTSVLGRTSHIPGVLRTTKKRVESAILKKRAAVTFAEISLNKIIQKFLSFELIYLIISKDKKQWS